MRLLPLYSSWIALCTLCASCVKTEPAGRYPQEPAEVRLNLTAGERIVSRAFANGGPAGVDRILVIPFQKSDASAADTDNTAFAPVYSSALQLDPAVFPVSGITLLLWPQTTYKLLVLGYTQSDFDYTASGASAATFSLGHEATPESLANLCLYPAEAADVPEFYSVVTVAFSPAGQSTLSATLTRLVSGLSVEITDIPDYIESIALRAGNLGKAIRPADAAVREWQSDGDGENRVFATLAPDASHSVVFDRLLLPLGTDHLTEFYLDVAYGSSVETYTVTVDTPDPLTGISPTTTPALPGNYAVNLSGDYATVIRFGFGTTGSIDLDDDAWDGLQ